MRTLLVCVTVIACVWLVSSQTAVFSQQAQETIKIGVVDLYQISQKWKKWVNGVDKIQKAVAEVNDKLEKEEQRINDMETRFSQSGVDKNSEQGLKAKKEIEAARAQAEDFKEKEENRIEQMTAKYGKELISAIEDVVKKYAQENKFTLVFKIANMSAEDEPWEQLQSYVRNKQVIYYKESMDITPAILKILQNSNDKQY